MKIDLVKLDHFLSFVNQPYFYQDVAYGTRTLKLDSGEELLMPNVIRIVARSTMIEQYLKHCSEDHFEPLSRSTLFRVLQVREASQRKSLQGLDNIAAGGAEAFESVRKIVDDLKNCGASGTWCDEVQNKLKSLCADHWRYFALSNLQDPELSEHCPHQHQVRCIEHEQLKVTLKSIADQIESPSINYYSVEQKEDFKHDLAQAREMIFQWKSHILRAENQERAKQDVLKSLQDNSVMVVMDWAMKFLQIKYREKQSEWFGKRGINWHVSYVISKNTADDGPQVQSYVHLFDTCAQDWYTVCAILEHLLTIIKENKPEVNQAFLRSDGVGCYHNNNVIAAVHDLGVRVGVKVTR